MSCTMPLDATKLTLRDTLPHDVDVVIAVGAGLLVPEAQSMEELMLYGGDAVAATPDGQLLFTHTSVPH